MDTTNATATSQTGANVADMMAAYFADQAKASSNQGKKPKRQADMSTINLSTSRTEGTVIVKLIYDDKNPAPIPTRTIFSFFDVRVPYQPKDKDTGELMFKDNGEPVIWSRRVRFMEPKNYRCTLSDSDRSLYEEVCQNLNKWEECKAAMEKTAPGSSGNSIWFEYRKQLVLFYGFLCHYSDKNFNEVDKGGVRLFRTHASDFSDKFSSAIALKSRMKGGNQWLAEYINRNTGMQNKAVVIKTERPNIGYETTVTFDEYQPFEVTEEDLANARDLYSELVDASYFDEAGLKELNAELIKNINAYTASARANFGQSAPVAPAQAQVSTPTPQATVSNPSVAPASPIQANPVNVAQPQPTMTTSFDQMNSINPPSSLPV